MRLFLAIFILLSTLPSARADSAVPVPKPNWEFLKEKLKREHFSSAFVDAIKKTYEEDSFESVVRLNVLLYLKKTDYHGAQVTPEAAREVREFRDAHREVFQTAEKRYKVPSGIVASLLWIESRHGQNTGEFHVPSVYLHLLQAPRREVQLYLQSQTGRYADKVSFKDREEIRQRTYRKSKFALQELKAIQKIFSWHWRIGKEFRGSFSGAFGMPQFLPSSYITWARATKDHKQPDLNKAGDAIMSVAHYLSDQGWKNERPESRLKALLRYNNSEDYANAILNLAEQLDSRSAASAP